MCMCDCQNEPIWNLTFVHKFDDDDTILRLSRLFSSVNSLDVSGAFVWND